MLGLVAGGLQCFIDGSNPGFPFRFQRLPSGGMFGGKAGHFRFAGLGERFDLFLFGSGAKACRFGLALVQSLKFHPVPGLVPGGHLHRVLIVLGAAFYTQIPGISLGLAQTLVGILNCVLKVGLKPLGLGLIPGIGAGRAEIVHPPGLGHQL